jgi:hypothetical protein
VNNFFSYPEEVQDSDQKEREQTLLQGQLSRIGDTISNFEGMVLEPGLLLRLIVAVGVAHGADGTIQGASWWKIFPAFLLYRGAGRRRSPGQVAVRWKFSRSSNVDPTPGQVTFLSTLPPLSSRCLKIGKIGEKKKNLLNSVASTSL